MVIFAYLTIFLFGFVYSSSEVAKVEEEVLTTPKDDASKILTEVGYLRYGDPFYIYPDAKGNTFQFPERRNPTETNEVENPEEARRPLFIFTTSPLKVPPRSGPYIEIRKKRDTLAEESELPKTELDASIPESSKIGKLRRKRTYCRKCGGGYGGHGGYGGYVPVSYAVYPVYTAYVPSYGGGGGGCHTCGGGGGGYGGGGSYSYSSSSSHSSAGSFGWGK